MTFWEIIILILVAGTVFMVEALAIMAGVSRMIDAKTESKIKLTTAVFKEEIECFEKVMDKYCEKLENMVKSFK